MSDNPGYAEREAERQRLRDAAASSGTTFDEAAWNDAHAQVAGHANPNDRAAEEQRKQARGDTSGSYGEFKALANEPAILVATQVAAPWASPPPQAKSPQLVAAAKELVQSAQPKQNLPNGARCSSDAECAGGDCWIGGGGICRTQLVKAIDQAASAAQQPAASPGTQEQKTTATASPGKAFKDVLGFLQQPIAGGWPGPEVPLWMGAVGVYLLLNAPSFGGRRRRY